MKLRCLPKWDNVYPTLLPVIYNFQDNAKAFFKISLHEFSFSSLNTLILSWDKLFLHFQIAIARNRGHFAPVINCQRNLIFKMADKDYCSQGKRIPYDILNNLSSVDLFYEEKGKKKTPSKKILGVYRAERLIARKQDADVSKTVLHWTFCDLQPRSLE